MQIKTTIRHHLTPVRMAIIKKNTNSKCRQGCGQKGIFVHCWWECKLMQPLWKTLCRFVKKLKPELPYNPAIPLLGIYQEKQTKKQNTPENTNSKRCMHTSVHRSIINSCWDMDAVWVSIADEWMKKRWHIYTHTVEYNSAIKRNKSLSFATMWMELEGIYLNKSEREIQILSNIIDICGI